jgi:hypothetical protein
MQSHLDILRRKLQARTNSAGFEKNCDALKAEIARLTASSASDISTLAFSNNSSNVEEDGEPRETLPRN